MLTSGRGDAVVQALCFLVPESEAEAEAGQQGGSKLLRLSAAALFVPRSNSSTTSSAMSAIASKVTATFLSSALLLGSSEWQFAVVLAFYYLPAEVG